MKINYEMLQQDINFPLIKDPGNYSIYIWDNEHHMVANYLNENFIDLVNEKVLGEMKIIDESQELFFIHGDVIVKKDSLEQILLVRGWGRLQYKDNAEERQENILNYLLNCLNS